jgi:hypothetical protein
MEEEIAEKLRANLKTYSQILAQTQNGKFKKTYDDVRA